MSEGRLTNIIVPSVFDPYTVVPSIYKSKLYNSGAMILDASLTAKLNGGGLTFNAPFWNDVGGTTGDIPQEGTDATVNALTTGQQVMLRQLREKHWGQNDLSKVEAGESAIDALGNMVNAYYANVYDTAAIKSLYGVVLDNVANDSGDLVNDISALSGSAVNISDEAVIDAQAKLGENGDGFSTIVVHPLVAAYLRKQDAIDYVPISTQERPMARYLGMNLVEDRNATLVSTVYYSYILKPGALIYGIGTTNYTPTEVWRKQLDGFGIDVLSTRRVFSIHPYGTAWAAGSVAGTSPTDAELALATNWNRVMASAENMKLAVVKHKLV